jgi:hypothetical protein
MHSRTTLDKAQLGEYVLDVGCGCGATVLGAPGGPFGAGIGSGHLRANACAR